MASIPIQLTKKRLGALERITEPEGREELKRRALSAIGRFRSDVTDLAAEHDRYLDEEFGRWM